MVVGKDVAKSEALHNVYTPLLCLIDRGKGGVFLFFSPSLLFFGFQKKKEFPETFQGHKRITEQAV